MVVFVQFLDLSGIMDLVLRPAVLKPRVIFSKLSYDKDIVFEIYQVPSNKFKIYTQLLILVVILIQLELFLIFGRVFLVIKNLNSIYLK